MNCSIAQALEALGDWWTLLIIREAFLGTRRFADFESRLGIAKNVLTQRLQHLLEHDILTRVDVGRQGQRFEYRLTDKGKDLLTVMTALRQWSDRWVFGPGNEPLLAKDKETMNDLPPVRVTDAAGRALDARDIVLEPGPGASEETLERYREFVEQSASGPSSERR